MSEQQKTCNKCGVTYDNIHKSFPLLTTTEIRYSKYCKTCKHDYKSKRSAIMYNTEWGLAGYECEQDHFNAAIKHYAEIFNFPELLKFLDTTEKRKYYNTKNNENTN